MGVHNFLMFIQLLYLFPKQLAPFLLHQFFELKMLLSSKSNFELLQLHIFGKTLYKKRNHKYYKKKKQFYEKFLFMIKFPPKEGYESKEIYSHLMNDMETL